MTNKIEIVITGTDATVAIRRKLLEDTRNIQSAFARMSTSIQSSVRGMDASLATSSRNVDRFGREIDGAGDDAASAGRKIDDAGDKATRAGLQFRTAGSAAEGFGERVRHASEKARDHLARVATALAVVGTALAVAGAATAALGIKTVASNQQAMISFEVLLGSQRKALDFLGELKDFAAATPFDLPGIQTAASRLLAVGVEAKHVIPLMTAIGDATAGMGTGAEGIERAVYALQQMKQSGRASLEDINQLMDAGIPALDALAAHFKTTVKNIRDRISAGKISADDVFGAIERYEGPAFQRLKGMMERQSGTLAGVWSAAEGSISQSLADAFEPAVPSMTRAIKSASDAIPVLFNKIRGAWHDLEGAMGGTGLKSWLGNLKDETVTAFLKNLKSAWHDFIQTVKDNKDEIAVMVKILGKLGQTIVEYSPVVIKFAEMFLILGVTVVKVVRAMSDSILGFVSVFLRGLAMIPFNPLKDQLSDAADKVDEFKNRINESLSNIKTDVRINVHGVYLDQRGVPGPKTAPRAGGRVAFADGGYPPATDWFKVGERGEEWMNRRTGQVLPHGTPPPAEPRGARGPGVGVGGQGVNVGNGAMSALVELFNFLWRTGQIQLA